MSDDIKMSPDATVDEDGHLVLVDGSRLFSQGEVGHTAYIVVEGLIEVFISRPDGAGDIILTVLEPGEIVGHMALLDDSPRSASSRAKGDAKVRVLDQKQFLERMGQSPDLALKVMSGLADSVRGANDKIMSVSLDQPLKKAKRQRDETGGSFFDSWLPWRNKTRRTMAEFQPDALEIENEPVPAAARLGAYGIILFLGAIVTWASVSQIDTAVSTRGVTAPTSANIQVQATESGIIRELNVFEGQIVEKGDLLVSLDNTDVQTQIDAAIVRRDNLEARLNRLTLEHDSRMERVTEIPIFSTDDVDNERQREIYITRNREFSSQIASFERQLENMNTRSNALEQEISLARRQLSILQELEEANNGLFEKKVVSRPQLLSTVYDRIGTEREILNLTNQREDIAASRRVTEADLTVYVNQWFTELTEAMLQTREELIQVQEELISLYQRLENLEIHAHMDAVVLDTHGFAIGSVMRAAEPIVTMVPNHSEMLVRLDIDAKDISKVTVGSRVSVKLDALPFQKHGDIEGRIESISEDTFEETLLGEPVPVYRARVHIEGNNLADLPPDFRLIPGMNVTGDIRTGERRIITYFIYPILRWLKTSLRET